MARKSDTPGGMSLFRMSGFAFAAFPAVRNTYIGGVNERPHSVNAKAALCET